MVERSANQSRRIRVYKSLLKRLGGRVKGLDTIGMMSCEEALMNGTYVENGYLGRLAN